jgi:hypothetical protein
VSFLGLWPLFDHVKIVGSRTVILGQLIIGVALGLRCGTVIVPVLLEYGTGTLIKLKIKCQKLCFYAPCLLPRIRNPSTDCEQAEGERHERGIRAPGQPLSQVSQAIVYIKKMQQNSAKVVFVWETAGKSLF